MGVSVIVILGVANIDGVGVAVCTGVGVVLGMGHVFVVVTVCQVVHALEAVTEQV